jgi:hypothetical protein
VDGLGLSPTKRDRQYLKREGKSFIISLTAPSSTTPALKKIIKGKQLNLKRALENGRRFKSSDTDRMIYPTTIQVPCVDRWWVMLPTVAMHDPINIVVHQCCMTLPTVTISAIESGYTIGK